MSCLCERQCSSGDLWNTHHLEKIQVEKYKEEHIVFCLQSVGGCVKERKIKGLEQKFLQSMLHFHSDKK